MPKKSTRMDEKKRIKRYIANREEFDFKLHNKHIQLVEKTTLKNVKVKFDRRRFRQLQCYLYHFGKLGITPKDIEGEFEGKTLLIYRIVPKRISRRKVCPFCYQPVDNFEEHIIKAHDKTLDNIQLLEFQKNLYSELLRIIRETEYYMSLAFINAGCQMCDDPIMEGRELCCSIPTSFRDRSRSLSIMGVSAESVSKGLLHHHRYGQIILAP